MVVGEVPRLLEPHHAQSGGDGAPTGGQYGSHERTRTCAHVGAVNPSLKGCIHRASLGGTSRRELPSRITPPNRCRGRDSPATDQPRIRRSITLDSTPASRKMAKVQLS